MKKTFTLLFMFLCSLTFAQTYNQTAPPACCDSNGVFTAVVYCDSIPTSTPGQYESKIMFDSLNDVLYTYVNNTWSAYGSNYKKAFGFIYWNGSKWDVLNNVDHQSHNIDSVSDHNGIITIHHNLGATKVKAAYETTDSEFDKYGITLGGSYGLDYSNYYAYIAKEYSSVVYARYANNAWTVSHYGGSVYSNPSILSWDSTSSLLTIGHAEFTEPCFQIKNGGTGYQDFKVVEYSSGYAYDNTRFQIQHKTDGSPYKPVHGDWFIFKREGKKATSSQIAGSLNQVRISNWSFLPPPSNTFTNFSYLIILE